MFDDRLQCKFCIWRTHEIEEVESTALRCSNCLKTIFSLLFIIKTKFICKAVL